MTFFLIRYDLKQGMVLLLKYRGNELNGFKLLEISKSPVSKVPLELAKHEAAQHKVSREMKRKREDENDT